MFHRDLLNRRSHFHLLLDGPLFLQRAIETCSTYRYQLTHALDTQAALPRHHFPDLVVDVFSPELLLRWRRASTFCKAPLKKSTSIVFSASKRFNCRTCWRSSGVLGTGSPCSTGSSCSRHLYRSRRCKPSSCASATMLSQLFKRSTTIRRNSLGYRPTRLFATRSPFLCKVCP